MHNRFAGSDAKIERAKDHIRELETSIRGFIESNPYRIVRHQDATTGDHLFVVFIDKEMPVRFGAIVGDVLNNLRSALDYLMFDIIEGKRNERIYFPIRTTAIEYKAVLKGIEKVAGKEAVKLLQSTEAYQGGKGHGLWQLHELNRREKHRFLIPVGVAYRHFIFDPAPGLRKLQPEWDVPSMAIAIRPADRMFPLQNGAVLFSIKAEAVNQTDMDVKFAFEIAFGEGQVMDGEPVLPTLTDMTELVQATTASFRSLFAS
jgi:hypothetical protein